MSLRCVLLCAAILAAAVVGGPSQGATPDDLYLQAYRLIAEGDQFTEAGRREIARQRYEEAQNALKKLQNSYPTYNRSAVQFRLDYLQDKVVPAAQPAASPATPAVRAQSPAERISQLEAENAMLQAKLQEALAPKPAAIDPQELVRAEERIRQLEKEKEVLRANLEQAEAKQPQAVDTAMAQQLKTELESTRQKLAEAVANIATLTQQKQALETQLSAPKDNPRPAEPDPALAEAQEAAARAAAEAAKLRELAAKLEEDKTAWQKTAAEFQEKMQSTEALSTRARKLQTDNEILNLKVQALTRDLEQAKNTPKNSASPELQEQVKSLRARLEVLEAKKVPYSAEELALFDRSSPKAAPPVQAKAEKPKELPPGASRLVAEAERAYAARRFKEAEEKYKEVLRMDEQNPITLANLAAIQLELDKVGEAEQHLERALAAAPDDAYALQLLGILRFRQQNFDAALDLLSRAAQLDPKNAETQNYLGISLSEKGQREAAETALRKAIMLAPNYGVAHYNLAVVYATQKPPVVELAKFHYNKALGLGHPANPQFEAQLRASK